MYIRYHKNKGKIRFYILFFGIYYVGDVKTKNLTEWEEAYPEYSLPL
jgi:hypothetical protein